MHTPPLLEPAADLAHAPVLGTGYNVAQLAVGGIVIVGAAALAVYGIRKMFQGALGKG